jgi:hypothetical protein
MGWRIGRCGYYPVAVKVRRNESVHMYIGRIIVD